MKFQERFSKAWTSDSLRLIATPSLQAKLSYYYIQEVGYFKTLNHYYTERSGLYSYLFIYTLSGKGHLKYRNKDYTMTTGQLMFINCMDLHYYETDKSEPWEILWVHFNGATTSGYYHLFNAHHEPITTLSPSTQIPNWIYSMIELHKEKHLQREVLCSNLLLNCLTELLVTAKTYPDYPHIPETINQIQNYLDTHFHENITLDILSKKFAISKYHLTKIYKRYTGFSIIDYMISLRITHAKQLLEFSNLTIQSIANEVGIDNVSHFISLFKKRENVTPLQFRKRWQNKQS